MDFKKFLPHHAKKIHHALTKIFDTWEKKIDKDDAELRRLYASFRQCVYGGKMVRGALVVLGYELTNARRTSSIYDVAAAVEILHTSLLVHDDIIDNSPLRRGRPALHKQSAGYARKKPSSLGP